MHINVYNNHATISIWLHVQMHKEHIHMTRIKIHIPISAHAYDAQIYKVTTVSEETAVFAAASTHRTLAVEQVQDLGGASE